MLACDWYRRLGLHAEGLRCVGLDASLLRSPVTEFDRKRMLWAGRFLNLMGAPEFAKPILKHFEPRTAEENRIIGTIYLANFDYDRAAHHLKLFNSLDDKPESYLSRLSQINFSDALNGLGQFQEAITVSLRTFELSPEPLLQGIALQARGEYLARNGYWSEAMAVLLQASTRFSPSDQTPDMAFLLKWMGYVELKLGQKATGRGNLLRALEILRKTALRPEAWLDVYRLLGAAGDLSASEMKLLSAYPGLASGFKKLLPDLEPSSESIRTSWVVDLNRNEYSIGKKMFLGIPTEIRAMAFIAQTGDWGLPLVKLKALLWPEEAYAFLQLEGRVSQILHRLRANHGTRLRIERGIAYVIQPRVGVRGTGTVSLRPSFLEISREFKRSTVEAHYGVESAQAARWISDWTKSGWIKKIGRGPRSLYASVPLPE